GDVVDELFARVDDVASTLTPFWTLADHLGSIRDVIDGSGSTVKSVAWDSFGNVADDAGSGELGRYGWTGRERELEIEHQYNRARYYDSTTGRWISQDPMGFDAGDSNLY